MLLALLEWMAWNNNERYTMIWLLTSSPRLASSVTGDRDLPSRERSLNQP